MGRSLSPQPGKEGASLSAHGAFKAYRYRGCAVAIVHLGQKFGKVGVRSPGHQVCGELDGQESQGLQIFSGR